MTIRSGRTACLFGGLLLAALPGACAEMEMPLIDPPLLHLDAPRYSNLPRGDYVITNGKGEVLMEAPNLRPGDDRSARFDLDKLDGTVNIAVVNAGTTTYTQTLNHTPGVPIRLEWKEGAERFDLTEQPAQRSPGTKAEGGGGGRD